jgi:X-Pro dipeptidyl-peptidase
VWIVQDVAAQAPLAVAAAEAAARNPDSAAANAARAGRGGRVFRQAAPPTPFASFPVPGSVPVLLHPQAGGNGVGSLGFSAARNGTDKLVDSVAESGSADAMTAQSKTRLLYATPVLTDTAHLSGTPKVTLRIASSAPAANLSVWLVMLPYDSTRAGSGSHVGLLDRGWADIQNYKSLTHGGNYDSKVKGEKLVPGKFYDLTFDLEPDDEFVPAGKQLAVMIMSSDREFTLWPKPGTELTIDLAHSSFSIPIVGGTKALNAAGMK